MKKQLILAAAALLAASAPATAGDNGRTVCVLRARPVAIQPVYRPVARPHMAAPVTGYAGNYGYGYGYGSGSYSGYGYSAGYNAGYYRVPAVYGHVNPRLHYVSPCMPNGYVGGLRNLPTNVVQIPYTFGRAPYCAPVARPVHAAPQARTVQAAPPARAGRGGR